MLNIETVKSILGELGFPEKHLTDLTAIAILALNDEKARAGLVLGKKCLSEGARITDIIEFAKTDLGRSYAENSRETIRKHSLKYLVDFGIVQVNADDPKRPVNSGNTHYTLIEGFNDLLAAYNEPLQFAKLKVGFVDVATMNRKNYLESLEKLNVTVQVPFANQILHLSPGDHNIIEKLIVEEIFTEGNRKTSLVYLGDTRDKSKFINLELIEKINLSVDEHSKLPDVVGFDNHNNEVMIFEAVASSGPVDVLRKKELELLFARCPFKLNMATVFLKRSLFQKFSNNIAADTTVYVIENKTKIRYEGF